MSLTNEKNLVSRVLPWGALATLLTVTPWATLDPINVPKFSVLAFTGGILIALILRNIKVICTKENRSLLVMGGLFLVLMIVAFTVSPIDSLTQLFGVSGRNTGFITYLSLLAFLIGAATLTKNGFEKRFIFTLISGGLLSIAYGLIQEFNLDPASWVNPYSPIIGFLGNPDFQSSFIGMTAVASFALLISTNFSTISRLFLLAQIVISLFVIYKSDAQQGFLVLISGSAAVLAIYIYQSKFRKFTLGYIVLAATGFFFIALGTLNKGPLAAILHKESVIYRGDYWRAGWKITIENPFFGVGFDGYGDWYRRSRTLEATLRRGPDVTSNAAHNVLLDLSSNGGLPLLGAYLALMTLVIISVFKVLRSGKKFNPYFAALVGAWVAYTAQSIISLNQIGLAVWGWILSGAIIGFNAYRNEVEIREYKPKGRNVSASNLARGKISPAATVAVFMGIVLGTTAGLPPYLASTKYRNALESGDPTTIAQAAYIWPLEVSRLGQVAATLRDNKMEDQALPIIVKATNRFPDSYEAWKILASLSTASSEQISHAKAQMKRLDPHNPELK